MWIDSDQNQAGLEMEGMGTLHLILSSSFGIVIFDSKQNKGQNIIDIAFHINYFLFGCRYMFDVVLVCFWLELFQSGLVFIFIRMSHIH